MTFNPRYHLVLIRGEDRTESVQSIIREGGRTRVTFQSGKPYSYHAHNVEWHSKPQFIPILDKLLYVEGNLLFGVKEALRFGGWVKTFHRSGITRLFPFSSLTIQEAHTPSGRSRDVLAYFRELAEGSALKTDQGDAILESMYRDIDSISDKSILPAFIQGRLPASEQMKKEAAADLIFPYNCNMSQKTAIQAALMSRVSLIQGPPGTGKTQTILNLIANLLLQGKKVAVVSNNNTAIANILDRLKKNGLGFLAAFLGSRKNKQEFIDGQSTAEVQLPALGDIEKASARENIRRLNRELELAFHARNNLADITKRIDAFRLESIHFEKFRGEREEAVSEAEEEFVKRRFSSNQLLTAWMDCERKSAARASSWISRFSMVNRAFSWWERNLLLFRFGLAGRLLFSLSLGQCISVLQKAYYSRKIEELESRKKSLEASLEDFQFEEGLNLLSGFSSRLLNHVLAKRFGGRERTRFSLADLWRRPKDFLREYPIVLSTTFSVITSIRYAHIFDFVIVDEASQVDLLSGVLAMGCAKQLVVVGDSMQLPNVLPELELARARSVAEKYEVPEHARYDKHNLLSAVQAAFPGIPETMLREHYRCHPKIIEFCNRKFYRDNLILMTRDQGEPDVLKIYVTVEGKHAKGTFNQRQIDEIKENALKELNVDPLSGIGIVTPFRRQAEKLRDAVDREGIEIDTVHKFQGREKRFVLISTVSNNANPFVDDPRLLNVAISRAQEKLWLVVSKEMAEGTGNIADFVRHVRYQNGEILPGRIHSVFDLLFSEYNKARREELKKRKRISAFDSENLAYGEIESVLNESEWQELAVVTQFPLSMLVKETGHMTPEEIAYVRHPWTKVDFLIFRRIDKSPVLAIEIDGYAFHREGTRQAERDALKNSALRKSGLPILRLSTIGSNEQERIREKLREVV